MGGQTPQRREQAIACPPDRSRPTRRGSKETLPVMKNMNSSQRTALALFGIAASLAAAGEARAQAFGGAVYGAPAGGFGTAIANAGDVDGDGCDDLLVGEPFYYQSASLTYQGRVSLVSGATHAVIRTHEGTQAQEMLGTAVSGAGDMNGDGRADYAIGSWNHGSNGLLGNGEVVIYSGADGSVLWSVDGTVTNQYVGFALAPSDDVDGDGKPDLLVANYNNVVNLFGATGSVIYTLAGQQSSLFGFSLARCGDVDGDGVRDFIIGAPYYSSGAPSINFRGGAYVYSAATGAQLYVVEGDSQNDNLGRSVGGVGDVDGDGIPDLLAGSYTSFGNGSLSGMVRVASGATGATIRTTYGDGVNDRLGWAVLGIGDLDQDGVPDYAASTIDGTTTNFLGRVRAYSGATGAVIYEWMGASTPDFANGDLGSALATGDFNRDGVPDLVIGDQSYFLYDAQTGQWTKPGAALIYFGCPASSSNYGAGWPGLNGVPAIYALDKPVPGQPLTVQIDNSRGAPTSSLLLLGYAPASIHTNKDGTILVSAVLAVALPLSATGASLSTTLPDDPALDFFDVYLQALEADPFASKGVSFTRGLKLHCGFDL
jgi:hypothetical protein